jgi:hypothetical protein
MITEYKTMEMEKTEHGKILIYTILIDECCKTFTTFDKAMKYATDNKLGPYCIHTSYLE